ncbi:hypothetical protein BC749_102871 [Flavobacterium araucananum]|uniref:DUF6603 domain-containing protein n=1 Tax=Flavobacterium araucananum TaxID=946678 RepID=A0A227P575_9FLAO|nr:DUF6603 domain-containing protein [Flavobacterium araucananum]OXG04185.1 hypothetical protein B0A64_16125 [Flavobacterium araucananum]PWK01295.1 hypothetical protein BC749_102871 [Flavobacterium araucananum]
MSDQKPFLVEITGETQFDLGNPQAAIAVDIAIGYRSRITKEDIKERYLYASLQAANDDGITIKDLIKSCTTKETAIPEFLDSVAFSRFSVTYGTGGIKASEFIIEFDCKITINKKELEAKIAINYKKTNEDVSFSFGGILRTGEHSFGLEFSKINSVPYLYARYLNSGETTIDLRKIAEKFFEKETVAQMPDLSFTLKEFKAFLLYKKEANKSVLFFGMGAGFDIDLKKLPMAGPIISQDNAFAFKEVLAIYANGSFSKTEFKNFIGLPSVDIEQGLNISTQLQVNGVNEYYVLNDNKGPQLKDTTKKEKETEKGSAVEVAPMGGGILAKAKWKKLDKKIGPVSLQRLGFVYEDSKVVLLLDAAIEMAGMGLQLMGFGLGFKLKWKPDMPDFYLEGIGLSYKAPPIEISGAFLHSKALSDGKMIDVYSGGAIIKISRFTISAIGSYADVKGEASLFIYGVFDGPIGGPAFFFVTGIAAGFGYNRKVNVPSIDEVALFPLVALAMKPEKNSGLISILNSLEVPMRNKKTPIEISIGDYWFAVGIKFTSFKLIESFVLLTVNFGTQLEFAILGLSRLSWPEKSLAPEPIVYIELAVLAHFGPGSDVISVEAVITPNSYILSKDCKLSGGFAFYSWVKGPHEGDFVITLGGYHPKFIKPAHYPSVPRLALNWKVSNSLSIRGEMYYALTSSAIMAGGKWEVLFTSSIIKASILIWADMLISWAPYQYYIDLGICVKIEATIKILFIRIHFSLEMGAQLHIWGPPFAGEAYVDWAIFSFTIPFGDHSGKTPAKLSWKEFSLGFVPQKKENASPVKGISAQAKANPVSDPEPTNITISNGLIEVKEEGKDKFPVINPCQLAITIDSFIPVTLLTINKKEIDGTTLLKSETGNITYNSREKNIGIRPCGFTTGSVSFEMNVDVLLNGSQIKMSVTGLAKGVAEALWSGSESKSSNTNPGTAKVITNVLSGLLLQPPVLPNLSQIRTFDFSKLTDEYLIDFKWFFELAQSAESYHATEVLSYYDEKNKVWIKGTLEKTYNKVKNKRDEIFRLLKADFDESFEDIDEIEISKNMANEGHYFKGIPVICPIGMIPQYSTDVQ